MNAKYALALILALQVSVSLCEVATPSPELVEKYEALKAIFFKRLLTAYGKLQAAAVPVVDQIAASEQGQVARGYYEELQSKPEFKAVVKVATGIGEEVTPLVDKARASALGLYEQYLRSYIGSYLSESIDNIKVYLNMVLPTE